MITNLAESPYMNLLECLLLQQRIDEVASDYVENNTTAADAKAEVKKYQQAIFDGAAVLNMTENQRAKVREWIEEQKTLVAFAHLCFSETIDTAVWDFESWFTEWEKQTFGIYLG